ncbi:DUF4190 domain-containing protein [Streptomyces sp. TRM64462]|uniref:DUF4190 domain-containing protein n=1 Tax=Streptomyces sp. TRM64462 TaxID=2741726 RepID=UPI0015867B51|nr:DUF4190 domain-containing protein [Streptomyces sp. TRM64462]
MSDPNQQPGGFGPSPYSSGQPPQPGYGYPNAATPPPPPVGYPAVPPQPSPYGAQPANGMGTAGLVCGIIGIVLNVTIAFWFVGLILGILAIIFGAVGKGKVKRGEATNKGAANAGLVMGIIATVLLPSLILLFAISVFGASSGL